MQGVEKNNNEKIKGVALENRTGKQKSICADCDSKKSTLLKPIKPIKKQKWFLQITKHAYLL